MTASDANAVAAWLYPGIYSFYDWEQDAGDLAELLDPEEWGRQYFAADREATWSGSSCSSWRTVAPRSGSGCGRT